jgi:hypothetical protein
MTNYLKEWREGYLEDAPFTKYEKLKKSPKHLSNDKEKTLLREKERWQKYLTQNHE